MLRMYKIPEENWGEFLSQGDTMWCWAYALGGIFGLTKHEEIARLHEVLGQKNPDGTINDGAGSIGVFERAKEMGYVNDYKNIHYALKERRIQEIMKALEKGLPLFMSKKDSSANDHAVRVIGFDESKKQYIVIDSGKINYSPLAISFDVSKDLYSVDIQPENYAKINADFRVEATEVKKEDIFIEPEKEEVKTEETAVKSMNFTDVYKNDWFHDDLELCVDKGILNGKTETTFAPKDNVTRDELSAVLARIIRYIDSK